MTLDEIRHLLLEKQIHWSEDVLTLVLRSKGKCEYCDRDLFSSLDLYYFERDHIIPRGKGSNDVSNIAVACKVCNYLKRRWDPRQKTEMSATREELIEASRQYIAEKRLRKLAFVREHESLFRQYQKLLDSR